MEMIMNKVSGAAFGVSIRKTQLTICGNRIHGLYVLI